MKSLYRKALIALALLAPAVTTLAQDDICTLTLNWGAASSIGWSGDEYGANLASALKFYQDGVLIQTVSPTSGTAGTVSIQADRWTALDVVWQSGDYDHACSFTLLSSGGSTIVQCLAATWADGDTVVHLAEPCADCFAPLALRVDSLGHEAVRLAWEGTNEEYLLEVGPAGFAPGSGDETLTTATSQTVGGLEDGMMYDAYVYGYCDGTLTAPVRLGFTTPGYPVNAYPYTTGFEADDDHGWVFEQGATNRWCFGQAAPHSGEHGLYISADGGQGNGYVGTQSLSYAYRTFEMGDTGSYTITFDYRVAGDEYQGYMRAFLVPSSVGFTADAIPGTATSIMFFRNNTPAGWTDLKGSSPRGFFGQGTWATHERSVEITPATAGQYNLLFLWCNDGGQANPPAAAIDNVTVSHITCPSPTGFDTISGSGTELLLDWTAGGDEDEWQLSVNGGAYTNVYSHPHLLDNLQPGHIYRLSLKAVCGQGDVSLPAELTVSTPCPEMISEFPYVEDFEAYTPHSATVAGEMNPCWLVGFTGSETYPWVKVDATGNHYLYMYGTGATGGRLSYAVLPPVEGYLADLELSLDLRRNNANHDDTLLVGLMHSLDIYDGFDTVATLVATSGSFVRQRVHFTTDHGYARRIVLVAPPSYFDHSQYDDGGFQFDDFPPNCPNVDNVRLYPTPTCNEPENLRLTAATDESLALAWDAPYESMQYEVAYRTEGSSGDWMYDDAFDAEFTISGLDPSTTYEVQVRTVCDMDDLSYALGGTFRTLCEPIDEFPYIETFATTDWTACWTMLDADQGGNTWARSADGTLQSEYTYMGSTDDWAITPPITLPAEAEGYTLSFQAWARLLDQVSHLQVRLSTTGADTASFATLLVDDTIGHLPLSNYHLSLAEYAGQTIYIAFRHLSEWDDDLRIDNLRLRQVTTPVPQLDGPHTANVGVEATFVATLAEGMEDGLNYQWTSTMELNGHAAVNTFGTLGDTLRIIYDTVGTDTITLVAYNDFGYQGLQWQVSVLDLQAAHLPYSTGFEADDDVRWSLLGGANAWHIGDALAATGEQCLYISRDGGLTNTYDTATPSVSYAMRQLVIDQPGERYAVSFDWRCLGESDIENGIDYMRLFLIPDSVDLIVDEVPNGWVYTSDFSHDVPQGWIDLAGGPLADSAEWQHLSNNVLVEHAGNYNLTFVWLNDNEDGTSPAAAVDNLSIRRITCHQPSDVVLASATITSLSVSWTAGGTEEAWLATVGTSSQVVNTTSATFTGLQPGTYHTVSIRAICAEGDTSTAATARFTTEADCSSPLALPWEDDFSGWDLVTADNYLHPCWNRFFVYDGGYGSTERVSNHNYVLSDNYYSPSGTLLMYSATVGNIYFSLQFRSLALLPEVQLPANTVGVSIEADTRYFAFRRDSQSGDTLEIDFLEVGYMPIDTDPTTFIPVDTLRNHHSEGFVTQRADLPAYTADLGRLALRYHFFGTQDFNYVAIDRLAVLPMNGTVGIDRAEGRTLALWPNPATSSVSVGGLEAGGSLSVIDLGGRTVRTLAVESESVQIDVSTLPRGVYFLRATGPTTTATARLVVE